MAGFVSAQTLAELIRDGQAIELIDVRTPAEFAQLHVVGARNVPLDQLAPRELLASRLGTTGTPIYFICHSGGRSRQACERFSQVGEVEVFNVEGGTLACQGTGIPLHRGRRTISIERQVRIGAGSLVLLGFALAFAVHPWFLGLSAFVGAGLVFAGVTDICGMAMLLAKMPWNRHPSNNS